MGKTLLKDILREIKSSFGRFFAVFAIVMIGVAFFAGVTASSSDMEASSDKYYDDQNLMDLRLVSSIGFDDEDIAAIRKTEGVRGLFAAHTVDAVTSNDGIQSTVRVMTVPDENLNDDNDDFINRPRLKEGRLPEKTGECVIKYTQMQEDRIQIGDTITLSSGNETDITQTLKTDEFTVVGIVYLPYYLTYDIGQTDVGSGKINFCVVVQEDNFIQEYYTEVFATVEGAKALSTYEDAYFDTVGKTADRLEQLADHQLAAREQSIRDELEAEKAAALNAVYEELRAAVIQQLTEQYSRYYPGTDVTAIIEPMVEDIVQKNTAAYDTSVLDETFAQYEQEYLGNRADWKWYVLDRNSHYSYRDYKSSAQRMNAIAVVFPVFFIFVAALVCLTTMTRMVDEQRGLIGTYKALGYGRMAIAFKYVLYSLTASVIGGIAGCLFGLKLFPTIIYRCWNILYDLPSEMTYANHFWLSVIAVGSMTLVIVLSTIYACYSELVEVPSQLMRPKAPKKGKKILLEHIGFIWKHMSFSSKVSARNIFRYKKRFFMTVIGVAGGCALMMAGFGIKDSISSLIRKQYQEILKYDVSMLYSQQQVAEEAGKDARFEKVFPLYSYTSAVDVAELAEETDTQDENTVTVQVVSDGKSFQEYVTLRKRKSNTEYLLDDAGVCITEKMANDLKVKAGDTVYLQSGSGVSRPVQIAHVVEMYTNHYVYMTAGYYEKVFGETFDNNCLLGILKDTGEDAETALGSVYLNMEGVTGITFFTANIEKFESMISSLNLVTYVLILSAAALSFVVLYNLTNVNVSERIREIATIKVLGFYDGEVAMYVYRENIIITIIGAAAGLLLGLVLHSYIMKTVEMDNVMFGNDVEMISLVLAFILTVAFSLVVNLVMYRRLKKIPMVESLKSVE